MKERDYHKKLAIKYGSHNHWILYQFARNKLYSMMRKAKSDYFRLKIDACKATEPKASWKWINSFTGKGNKSSPVNDILVKDKIVSDYKNVSQSFNDFLVIGPELWPMNQRKGPPMLPHLSAIFRIAFKSFDSLIYQWKSHPTLKTFISAKFHVQTTVKQGVRHLVTLIPVQAKQGTSMVFDWISGRATHLSSPVVACWAHLKKKSW